MSGSGTCKTQLHCLITLRITFLASSRFPLYKAFTLLYVRDVPRQISDIRDDHNQSDGVAQSLFIGSSSTSYSSSLFLPLLASSSSRRLLLLTPQLASIEAA